jgi:hypothetical protein
LPANGGSSVAAASGSSGISTAAAGLVLPPDAVKLRKEMRMLASRLAEMTQTCARLQQVRGYTAPVAASLRAPAFLKGGNISTSAHLLQIYVEFSNCKSRQGCSAPLCDTLTP